MASSIQHQPTPDPLPLPQPQETSPSPSPSPSPCRQLIPMATASLTPTAADSDSTDYDTTPTIPMAIPMGVPIGMLPPVRRLPPPCWTPDETSVLIDAYRDIWFSLRRANLRANHWQDVADTIHSQCPDVQPPKTAVQCRHKMEKLRKRYRAELLRAKSIPHHRFSSSWVYFSKMDSIDKSPDNNININNNSSSSAASLPSPQPLSSVPFSTAAAHDAHDHLTPRTYSQPRPTPYPTHRFPTPPSHSHRPPPPTFAPDYDDSPPPHPHSTPYAFNNNTNTNNNKPGYASNYGTPPYNNPSRFVNTHDDNNNNAGPSGMPLDMDYVTSKKKRKMMSNGGGGGVEKRDHSGGLEMVQAIRMLGESFLNMEKMKMDMMRETERLRMEMEMKRTQMLLDSQHRIIQAFAKGCSDVSVNNTDDDHHHTAS